MKSNIKVLSIYFVIFYLAWGVTEFVLSIENPILYAFIREGILKILIWTLPAILLIKKYRNNVEISLKDMFTNKVNWLKYIPIFVVFTLYILIASYRTNGNLQISSDFGLDEIIVVIFVGITEEVVFRGWLLNATIKDKKEDNIYLPMLINAILFLTIHFPIWINTGVFITNFASFGFIQIILLSCVFSYIFIKSKNILIPIALHMYWDLLVFMF